MYNKSTERVFEILHKFSIGYDFQLNENNFSEPNEITELIEILTNISPFQAMIKAEIRYEDIINGNPDCLGCYYPGQESISYSKPFIISISKNLTNFMLLLDTIYHEQRHHEQDFYRENPMFINNIDLKQITDSFYDDHMNTEEIKELNNFANNHNLLGKMISKRKLKTLQFGAYLSRKNEIDARDSAFQSVSRTFKMIVEHKLCTPETKEFITRSYQAYVDWQTEIMKTTEEMMNSFTCLDNKVKSKLMEAMKSNKPLDKTIYTSLLNGMLDYITKNMTLQENLKVIKWALKNNYLDLADKVNLRNSLSYERRDLSNFINDIVDDDLLTPQNFSSICHLFSSFNQKTNDNAINYLVTNLADRASADVLFYHADIGSKMSFYSKYITPEILDVALSNYLSQIEHTQTITDYDKYIHLRNKIIGIQSSKLSNEDTKQFFLPYIERFKKIDMNKEIRIVKNIENEKNETLSV